MSKYTQRSPEEFKPSPSGSAKRAMCSTPGCQTYAGNGRYLPSFADIVVTDYGIRLCGECYTRGLSAAGKGPFAEITGRQPNLTIDLAHAHWKRLDEAQKAKEAAHASD